MTRSACVIACVFLAAVVDLLVNLIASALQGQIGDDLLGRSLWLLVLLAIAGLLVGLWLGGATADVTEGGIEVTRLRAFMSRLSANGQVKVSRAFLWRSKVELNSNARPPGAEADD